jgi:hypothetical protein
MLVYSTGRGVNGFTLDPSVGEFLLSHPNIRIPELPQYYSLNQGNEKYWSRGLRAYTAWLQGRKPDSPNLSARYIGSLVADFHRNLLAGGVFAYPAADVRGHPAGVSGGASGRERFGRGEEYIGDCAAGAARENAVLCGESEIGGAGGRVYSEVRRIRESAQREAGLGTQVLCPILANRTKDSEVNFGGYHALLAIVLSSCLGHKEP